MSCATWRRRALVLVAVGASQGWTASLLSLPTFEHHLVGFGVLVNADRQAKSKVSSHPHVFDSLRAFQPVRFELVSRDCQPSLPLLSLSPHISLSPSFRLTTHRYAHRQLLKLETVLEDTAWSRQATPFPGCSRCTCTSSLLCRWDTSLPLLLLFLSPPLVPLFSISSITCYFSRYTHLQLA